jgi:hypothetical protein
MSYTSRRMRKDPAAPLSASERLLLLLLLLLLFGRRPLPLLQRRPRLLVLARPARPASRLLLLLLFGRRFLLRLFLPLEGVEGVRAGLGRGISFPREVRTIVREVGPVALVAFRRERVVGVRREGVLAFFMCP